MLAEILNIVIDWLQVDFFLVGYFVALVCLIWFAFCLFGFSFFFHFFIVAWCLPDVFLFLKDKIM